MNEAAQQLKVFYANLIQVTCIAHGLKRVAQSQDNVENSCFWVYLKELVFSIQEHIL